MSRIASLFRPDHARYEGVRPVNVHLLRLIYFLMAACVATDSWAAILRHEGHWDPVKAVAFCVWAAYPTLSVLGIIHPLRMLPIMLFMIAYKLLWLAVVAWPLWRVHALAGTPAGEMARAFAWLPLPLVAVPWGYVLRTFVLPARRAAA